VAFRTLYLRTPAPLIFALAYLKKESLVLVQKYRGAPKDGHRGEKTELASKKINKYCEGEVPYETIRSTSYKY
jgi:hypothetical protein